MQWARPACASVIPLRRAFQEPEERRWPRNLTSLTHHPIGGPIKPGPGVLAVKLAAGLAWESCAPIGPPGALGCDCGQLCPGSRWYREQPSQDGDWQWKAVGMPSAMRGTCQAHLKGLEPSGETSCLEKGWDPHGPGSLCPPTLKGLL